MASSILLIAVYCGIVILLAQRKFREQGVKRCPFAAAAAGLFLLAFTLRLWLGLTSEGFASDVNTFKAWARITNEVGFGRIYREDIFLDYPPGYLFVLTLLEKLRLLIGLEAEAPAFTLLIKLPSILADLCCAGVLLLLAKRKMGGKNALFLSGAYLFCPAVFLNSAQWGQADSFCTAILLFSVLFLYRGLYTPSALLYGAAIACKPQMLVFAPLYLFFAIRQKRFWSLLWGVFCTVASLLLIAAPFSQGFHYMWLLEKYQSTMEYYHYYSINAYNFWALIRWNWRQLPEGTAGSLLNFIGPVIATVLCALLLFLSKRKDALFACPFVLMSAMYCFSVKMHERYLFPALLFLLAAYVFAGDKRLLYAFSGMAGIHYLNVRYVLWQFQEKGASYDPNTYITMALSALQLAAFAYLLYVTWSLYICGTVRMGREAQDRPVRDASQVDGRFTRADFFCVLAITLLYGCFAFWHLGDMQAATTSWTPVEGESVTLQAGEAGEALYYLPGIAAENSWYRVGTKVKVEVSRDGKAWTDCGELAKGSVFCWGKFELAEPGSYVRLTALDGSVVLNEVGLKRQGNAAFTQLRVIGGDGETLIDEAGVVPLYITCENSAYFDEIYHARTAYEYILHAEPYENTHPPLGKQIIALGILLFGMNPFGWRFMGALFGVLMLPVLYHLLKQLFGQTRLCAAGTLLFAFDFMHFTQTRIATIDTYAVFFLLLMYDAMTVFLRRDVKGEGWKRLLLPLLSCGIFTGLGVASKWTALYGAAGLAVLFFGKLGFSLLEEKREGNDIAPLLKKSGILCLWCCLFFLLIPFAIYFLSYLPMTTLPHNAGRVWSAFTGYQATMFNYHSQLEAEHYFASPWYEWPLDIRPIWYFSGSPADAQGSYSTISAMGNPLLWWSFLPALAFALRQWWAKRRRAAAVAAAGFLSVYLPWTLVPRLTFIYHYFTAVPFLVLALMLFWERLLSLPPLRKPVALRGERQVCLPFTWGGAALWGFVGLNLILFGVFFPVISGAPTTEDYANSLELFKTWYFAHP